MTKTKQRAVKVKGWAIYCKTLPANDAIVDVAFVGISDAEAKEIKLSKKMFVDDSGNPCWQDYRYKLIPCTITYQLPKRGKGKQNPYDKVIELNNAIGRVVEDAIYGAPSDSGKDKLK